MIFAPKWAVRIPITGRKVTIHADRCLKAIAIVALTCGAIEFHNTAVLAPKITPAHAVTYAGSKL